MTINNALNELTNGKILNEEQKKLKLSLVKLKIKFGGNTKIENIEQVKKIIGIYNKEK